jgi:hypothetical protein
MGAYFLHSPDLAANPQQVTPTNGGGPKLIVNKNLVKIKWFQVPYLVTKSTTLRMGRGKVNYELGLGDDFFDSEGGSLLLDSVKFIPNPGPYPPVFTSVASKADIRAAYWGRRFCDIEFNFIEFQIPPDQRAANPAFPGGGLPPLGVMTENHNRSPHVGLMKWVYSCNNSLPNIGKPYYDSFNMKALFTYKAT